MTERCSTEVLERLAVYLCDQRKQVEGEWIKQVHRDPELPTAETISTAQLRDHLPEMFDDLVDLLRAPEDLAQQAQAETNARSHGHFRWQQGYLLPEVQRELARVRNAIIDHLITFEDQNPEFRGVIKRKAIKRVHWFFDEQARRSTEQFVSDQEAELRRQLTEAQQGYEKMREIDVTRLRLLRTVAHELRNAFNAASLTTQSLLVEDDLRACHQAAGMLHRSNVHATALLNDLLDFSLLLGGERPLRPALFSLHDLCDELLHAHAPSAQTKGLALRGKCDPSLDRVFADRAKVRQVADNLLSNAIKYTAGGHVELTLKPLDSERWQLQVEDTGPGIPPEECQRIFSEFHRLGDTTLVQGTGLGLAITKRIVELLEGEICVKSQLGKGSCFEVSLPLGSQMSQPEGEPPAPR